MEADWERQYTMNMVIYLQELGASKAHFLCRTRVMQNHIRCHLGARCMINKSHSKRAGKIQEHQMLAPLIQDRTVGWCHSFVIVPKPNGTVCLCPNPTWLDQAIIGTVHRRPIINDILPKLKNTCYMTSIGSSSGYCNLKPDKKSSCLTHFACQFGIQSCTSM